MTSGSYIVAGARTPIGKMSGALASFSAAELGGFAITEALLRAGVAPDEVQHVIVGQVLMAGQGQVPSRQAAVNAGIPMSVPSVNVNKVCLSGLNTIYLANQMIAAGDADIVVAGGMESMTNAPYLAEGARGGFRYGNTELADAIIKDGLWCAFDACLMGAGTEVYTTGQVTREELTTIKVEVATIRSHVEAIRSWQLTHGVRAHTEAIERLGNHETRLKGIEREQEKLRERHKINP